VSELSNSLVDMMEGKFTVSFTDGFNYLHVHNNTGVDGTADGSPATIYNATASVLLFNSDGNYITYTV
jgi:hypothetical protein